MIMVINNYLVMAEYGKLSLLIVRQVRDILVIARMDFTDDNYLKIL